MSKEKYLEKLEYYLKESSFDREEIQDILEEYTMIIDEAIDNGILEEELEEHIGQPRELVRHLRKTVVIKRVKKNRLVALSPFIAMIVFFGLGFAKGWWNVAWLAFLLIPISGIISSKRKSPMKSLIELAPLISLLIFLAIGLSFKVWRPTWVIFFIIPALSILEKRQTYRVISFIVFISLPILYVLSFYFFPFRFNWLILLAMVLPAFYSNVIFSFRINGLRDRRIEMMIGMLVLTLLTVYIVFGSLYDIWHPLWLIFLLVPVASILLSSARMNQKISLVALSPFVAITLFFLFGYFFNGYYWSWMFFFLIPMTAIIKNS